MDSKEFDRIMDMCDKMGFKNKANRCVIPELASRLNHLLQAYILLLRDDEEKASVDEAFHGLAMVMLMHEARRCGIDPDKVITTFDALFGITEAAESVDNKSGSETTSNQTENHEEVVA